MARAYGGAVKGGVYNCKWAVPHLEFCGAKLVSTEVDGPSLWSRRGFVIFV